MIRLALAAALLGVGAAAQARDISGLDRALRRLAGEGAFSGAVVVRDATGVRFARGYGLADPFARRAFTPDTPVDSGSLAKPVTAAIVLSLAAQGKIDLDTPATHYLPAFPHRDITVRQLLSHSAGLSFDDTPEALSGRTNLQLVAALARRPLLFKPGQAFTYCNACTIVLAAMIERLTGQHYLAAARAQAALPAGVVLRPARLADWHGRAIGYRLDPAGAPQRFDSWDGEAFYGPANLSISAGQMAEWGAKWWNGKLERLRPMATAPARIGPYESALSLGNWYCSDDRARCHYLGHHEGFHHMLYWDSRRRLSIAMVTNNALAPNFQQPLQRAIVAFAQGHMGEARREIGKRLPALPAPEGSYVAQSGERLAVERRGETLVLVRRGIAYQAYAMDGDIRYVPGMDAYIAGGPAGQLRLLTLYEELFAKRAPD